VPEPKDSSFPEEWIASIVVARNSGREHIVGEGLSIVDDGTSMTLKDVIAANPINMLGSNHFQRFGDTLGVLVKLIDSFERLTIQVHPDRTAAKRLFSSDYGKTECWHILEGRTANRCTPVIYLGFKPGITREKWVKLFEQQNQEMMLECLHKLPANPGDTFLIEGGVPHAIGEGCFLVEIQEPTDYTIRVERVTGSGYKVNDFLCHQGLGFEKMFDCFSYTGMSEEEVYRKWHIKPRLLAKSPEYIEYEIIGHNDTPYFSAAIIEINGEYDAYSDGAFSGLFVLSGEGYIETNAYSKTIRKSDQFFIPAGAEKIKIAADGHEALKVVRFFGPEA